MDTFYDSEDFAAIESIELDGDEQLGMVMIPGQLVFSNLAEPGSAGPEYEAKYGATFRTPKGVRMDGREGTYGGLLFAVCDKVGNKAWKRDAEDKLAAVFDCIDKGVNPRNSNINVQDGDIHNPEFNRGTWQITARRRVDEGPVTCYDADGDVVEPGSEQYPKRGDICIFAITVWAQPKRDRINFTLEGVQYVQQGQLRMNGPDQKKIAGKFGALRKSIGAGFAKAIPAQVEEPEQAPTKAPTKPAAKVAAKPVAKKGIYRTKR